MGTKGEGYVLAQGVCIVLVALAPSAPGWTHWGPVLTGWSLWGGLALLLVGAGLGVAGLLSLGNNLTALPYPLDNATLVEHGAYRLVRHPIYTGLFAGALGWAVAWSSWAGVACALVFFVVLDIKARREEQWLAARFSGYAAYQRRVRKLIPWIY